jgi:hypothetical protein
MPQIYKTASKAPTPKPIKIDEGELKKLFDEANTIRSYKQWNQTIKDECGKNNWLKNLFNSCFSKTTPDDVQLQQFLARSQNDKRFASVQSLNKDEFSKLAQLVKEKYNIDLDFVTTAKVFNSVASSGGELPPGYVPKYEYADKVVTFEELKLALFLRYNADIINNKNPVNLASKESKR